MDTISLVIWRFAGLAANLYQPPRGGQQRYVGIFQLFLGNVAGHCYLCLIPISCKCTNKQAPSNPPWRSFKLQESSFGLICVTATSCRFNFGELPISNVDFHNIRSTERCSNSGGLTSFPRNTMRVRNVHVWCSMRLATCPLMIVWVAQVNGSPSSSSIPRAWL